MFPFNSADSGKFDCQVSDSVMSVDPRRDMENN